MFIVTTTYTRPNTSVDWFYQSDTFSLYYELSYIQTGKIVDTNSVISPDGLTMTKTVSWASREDFLFFIEDPQFQEQKVNRNVYLETNGIVMSVERRLVLSENNPQE